MRTIAGGSIHMLGNFLAGMNFIMVHTEGEWPGNVTLLPSVYANMHKQKMKMKLDNFTTAFHSLLYFSLSSIKSPSLNQVENPVGLFATLQSMHLTCC